MSKKPITNKDVTPRMFESDFLEFFSKVHFSVPLIVFIPVISYFIYQSLWIEKSDLKHFLFWILAGLAVWTLTEYVLHRFVFHFTPRGALMERIHFIFHGVHHDYPNDSKRLVMPPAASIPLAALFYFLFLIIFGSNIAPMFSGFLIGYLWYDMTHYAIHHFNMHSAFWLAIKNHHMKHHFQNPEKGFGVSTPIWDYVWQTMFPVKNK
ncbi:sterol desaturase family protein [bacterium]|nr:sterol desaturase family protein [bacterium]NUN44239.1 sterol desaturase family protein [bacterium]